MALSPKQMDQMMDEHFAFEGRDDVEGVLATLTEDVEHDIVGWPFGPAYGRDGARKFYETMFVDLADSSVRSVKRLYGENFMVDESIWTGKAPGRPFGLEGRDRTLEFRLLHVMEFAENGTIKRENVWLDLAAIMRQLPQD
jgi:predicted ester cyclase